MTQAVLDLELRRIRPNLRIVCRGDEIEALCQSIRLRGLQEPIQIWFDGQGFRILDGEKRWRACSRLGVRRVKALIVETPGPFRWQAPR